MSQDAMSYTFVDSPVGRLMLAGTPGAITDLRFMDVAGALQPEAGWTRSDSPFADAVRQLRAYFEGKLREFDLTLAPKGTPFQLRVWEALQAIPYGETISYSELARRIDNPRAVRAVGAANGSNPISIIVPCHRVIGSNGSLTGYGGGMKNKEYLLSLEGARTLNLIERNR